MPRAIDRPEAWLAIHGFLIAFAWEMFQMPFYSMKGLDSWALTKSCGIASFGDAGIMVFAFMMARWITGSRTWPSTRCRTGLAVYLLVGLGITLAVEQLAVRVPWGWNYGELMPTISGVGLVPLIMWIVVPIVSLGLALRTAAGSRGQ